MNLSVIVPVYNSEETLEELTRRLQPVMNNVAQVYELIFVNDDSRDRSWEIICRLARQHPWIRGLNLMRNYGQQSALLRGILEARYEVIVTMDDDLQNPPEEIPKLLDKLSEDYDVVYGTPQVKQHDPWRKIASFIFRLTLRSTLARQISRDLSSFRAFRTQVREAFRDCHGPFVPIDVPLTWGTTRFASVKVHHEPRRSKESNYGLGRLLLQALNALTGFSVLPLKLASMIGFFFTLFGLGVLIYVVARRLILGYSLPGFPFLASLISIFAGAQLFALGIIGEYLARMYLKDMGLPGSMVRTTTESPPEARPDER